MLHKLFSLLLITNLTACNYIHMETNSLDKSDVFYVDSGGNLMQFGTKQILQERGYKTTTGHKRTNISNAYISQDGTKTKISHSEIGTARYILSTSETAEKFRPIWCSLNGFWWSRFNISITDNTTGHEILHWTGRGCINSSIRLFEKILDNMEQK